MNSERGSVGSTRDSDGVMRTWALAMHAVVVVAVVTVLVLVGPQALASDMRRVIMIGILLVLTGSMLVLARVVGRASGARARAVLSSFAAGSIALLAGLITRDTRISTGMIVIAIVCFGLGGVALFVTRSRTRSSH